MELNNKFFKPEYGLIPHSITYNEVLMVPQYTEISSRKLCSVVSKFSKNVTLKIPIIASPMDTVTEKDMAIGMARNGGLGVIHRY